MRKRSYRMVLAGVLALALGGAGLVLAWQQGRDVQTVWVAARPLGVGQVIGQDDVTSAHVILGAGVTPVPCTQDLTGLVALVDVPGGAILVAGAVGQDMMPAGQARLSVVVGVGQAPVGALQVGGPLTLLGPGPATVAATLASPPRLNGAHHVLDVVVAELDAPRVAHWAAQGGLLVVV